MAEGRVKKGSDGIPCPWDIIPTKTPPESDAGDDLQSVDRLAESTSSPNIWIFVKLVCPDRSGGSGSLVIVEAPGQQRVFLASKEIIERSSTALGRKIVRQRSRWLIEDTSGYLDLEWQITITGFHHAAIDIVLWILHHKPNEAVREPGWANLIEISKLCQKFQLQQPLESWGRVWMESYRKVALDPGREDWLFITDILDVEKKMENNPDIKAKLEKLYNECSGITEDGKHVRRNGNMISIELWPSARRADFALHRKQRITYFQTQLRSLVTLLQKSCKKGVITEHSLCDNRNCIEMAYGSLRLSIEERGLTELACGKNVEWRGSVDELWKGRMRGISLHTYEKATPEHDCTIGAIRDRFNYIVYKDSVFYEETVEDILSMDNLVQPPSQTKYSKSPVRTNQLSQPFGDSDGISHIAPTSILSILSLLILSLFASIMDSFILVLRILAQTEESEQGGK